MFRSQVFLYFLKESMREFPAMCALVVCMVMGF